MMGFRHLLNTLLLEAAPPKTIRDLLTKDLAKLSTHAAKNVFVVDASPAEVDDELLRQFWRKIRHPARRGKGMVYIKRVKKQLAVIQLEVSPQGVTLIRPVKGQS